MKKYAFGVDIGGTTIKIGLFETSGNLIEKWEIPTRTQENGTYILNDMQRLLRQNLPKKTSAKKRLKVSALAFPAL